jgi:hypothetical protein
VICEQIPQPDPSRYCLYKGNQEDEYNLGNTQI